MSSSSDPLIVIASNFPTGVLLSDLTIDRKLNVIAVALNVKRVRMTVICSGTGIENELLDGRYIGVQHASFLEPRNVELRKQLVSRRASKPVSAQPIS